MSTSASPTISVIICTYNRHSLLQRAVDSVLQQDEKHFEIIIIDDGSDEPVIPPHEQNVETLHTTSLQVFWYVFAFAITNNHELNRIGLYRVAFKDINC
jgi:GT2 family glycosyltransferase